MHRRIGVSRCVVVQSALHGTDSSVTLDALNKGAGTRRGIVLVDPSIGDGELDRLHAAGVRGIRHNLVGHRSDAARQTERILALGERVRGLGWHFLLHMSAQQMVDLEAFLRRLPVPFVIDHFGRLDPSGGQQQPAFRTLLGLLATGRAWGKIGAIDKLSKQPYPHDDLVDIGAALVRAEPDRIIWGTDWPHPDARGLRAGIIPDDQDLANLIPRYAPDTSVQRKLLVDNPAELYGFA